MAWPRLECAPNCGACELEPRIGQYIDIIEHWPACEGCQARQKTAQSAADGIVFQMGKMDELRARIKELEQALEAARGG